MGFTRLKSRYLQAAFPSGSSENRFYSCRLLAEPVPCSCRPEVPMFMLAVH